MRLTTDELSVPQILWGRTVAVAVVTIIGVTFLTTAAEYIAFTDPLVNRFGTFGMILHNQAPAPVAAPDTLARCLLDKRLELHTLTPSTNTTEIGPIIRTVTIERGDTIIDMIGPQRRRQGRRICTGQFDAHRCSIRAA